MKIIFSPTKSQNTKPPKNITQAPTMNAKTKLLLKILESYSLADIKQCYKISDTLSKKTYSQYQSFAKQPIYSPIDLFTGTTFKQLEIGKYKETQIRYMNDHLVILSALYGCLEPDMVVYPYRLDMNNNIVKGQTDDINMYTFWEPAMYEYFKNEDIIINLASREYSDMIPDNLDDHMVHIYFITSTSGIGKTSAMDAKKQRGKLLNHMITHQVSDHQELQTYESDGYVYDVKKSDTQNIYFIKHI